MTQDKPKFRIEVNFDIKNNNFTVYFERLIKSASLSLTRSKINKSFIRAIMNRIITIREMYLQGFDMEITIFSTSKSFVEKGKEMYNLDFPVNICYKNDFSTKTDLEKELDLIPKADYDKRHFYYERIFEPPHKPEPEIVDKKIEPIILLSL